MTIFGDNATIDPRAIAPVPTTRDWREVRERDDLGRKRRAHPDSLVGVLAEDQRLAVAQVEEVVCYFMPNLIVNT